MKMPGLLMALVLFAPGVTGGHAKQTMTIKLYFPNASREKSECAVKVYPVTRRIPKTQTAARAALEQLFAGPTSEEQAAGFYSDFSETSKSLLISINIKHGAAYVNLRNLTTTSNIGNFTTSCGGSNFFAQVENTLRQFPSIKRVFFAMEGDPAYFYDWMQIGECPKELKNCDASNFIK